MSRPFFDLYHPALKQPAFVVTKMHTVALAPFPPFAGGAGAGFQWSMVTENAEALFPDFHEIVFIDITLAVLRTDAGAAGEVAVYTY